MKYYHPKKIVLFLVLLVFSKMFAQLSKEHYLPPLYTHSTQENTIRNYNFVLTTPVEVSFYVKFYEGVSKIPFDSVLINNKKATPFFLGNKQKMKGVIEGEVSLNKVLSKAAIISKAEFPFLLNARGLGPTHAGSMQSKGTAALGQEFYMAHIFTGPYKVPTEQNDKPELATNFISVVASKDNTLVKFSNFQKGVKYRGAQISDNKKLKNTTADIEVVLQKGESYTISRYLMDSKYGTENKSIGIHITASKPIATACGSIIAKVPPSSAGGDIGFDQAVPVELVGKEYLITKGYGALGAEVPTVIGTEDNTKLLVNGEIYSNLNKGEVVNILSHKFTDDKNMYIESSKPVYLYQTLTGKRNQLCFNFIPPLVNCLDKQNVQIPNLYKIMRADYNYLNIATKTNTEIVVKDAKTAKVLKNFSSFASNVTPRNKGWYTFEYLIPNEVQLVSVSADDVMNISVSSFDKGATGSATYYNGFQEPPIIGFLGGMIEFSVTKKIELKIFNAYKDKRYNLYKDGKLFSKNIKDVVVLRDIGKYQVGFTNFSCGLEVMSNTVELKSIENIVPSDTLIAFNDDDGLDHKIANLSNQDSIYHVQNLYFQSNKANLDESSIVELVEIISILKSKPSILLEIRAHTDCVGSEAYNLTLSQKRADFVKSELVKKGVEKSRIIAKGFGESQPITANTCGCETSKKCTDQQNLLNRRSEFIFKLK